MRLRETLVGIALLLLLAGIAVLGLLPPAQGKTPPYMEEWEYRDESRFIPIALPPGMVICREEIDGKYHCLPVPPGSVLLVPVPESAPVDSL